MYYDRGEGEQAALSLLLTHIHALLFLVVIRLVALGNFLGPLFSQGLSVAAADHRSRARSGFSRLFQVVTEVNKRIHDTTKTISVRAAPLSVAMDSSDRWSLGS